MQKKPYTLIGIRALSFTAESGEKIEGTQLFVSIPEEGVVGEITDKIFIRPEILLPKDLKPGDEINISFNRKGKAEAITKA